MELEAYNEYVRIQEYANNIWDYEGETSYWVRCQKEADTAYKRYQYAAGLISWEND